MAHIVDFEIAGLAGRKGIIKHKLDRNLNIFFGLNGTGKTSLLRILHSAMDADASLIENVSFDSAKVSIFSIDNQTTFTRIIEKKREPWIQADLPLQNDSTRPEALTIDAESFARFLSLQKDMQLQWKTEGLPPEKESIGFHHIYLPIWRLYATDRLVARKPESPSSRDKTYEMQWEEVFARSLEALWQRYSNQTLSEVKTIQARGIASILSALMTDPTVRQTERNIDAVRAYKRVAAFFQRQGLNLSLPERELFEQRFNEQPLIRRVVADISAIEQQVEESYSSRVKLESLIGSLFADNKSVRFSDSTIKVVARDQDIGLASLSAGEKQVLWLFIQVLRASSHSLLIDEPEISLHIDWQRQLVASMRQLNQHAQLVLASHSPEIMAEVPDEHIISL